MASHLTPKQELNSLFICYFSASCERHWRDQRDLYWICFSLDNYLAGFRGEIQD